MPTPEIRLHARSTWQHIKPWALAFGFWTLLGFSYAASAFISGLNEGGDPSWSRSLGWNLTNFYLWMLLTPVVAWLGRKGAAGWRRFWMLHVPCSLLLALLQTAVMLTIFWYMFGANPHMPADSLGDYLRIEAVYKIHLAIIMYWVLLAVLRGGESRRRLEDERLRNAQLETQLVQSQLQALRMQLQPHFLFNTLNAISALALSDPAQARLMIARLGDFLRLTLEERHASQIPLARELEFLHCYLGIQQVRFQDRLATHVHMAEDTLHAAVPNMILQPLVENALRHGLLPKSERGNLRISSRRTGDLLQLCVEDDGLGLPPDGPGEGVGLGNTRERLKVLFGHAARLDLQRRSGGGTRVEIHFPFREYAT